MPDENFDGKDLALDSSPDAALDDARGSQVDDLADSDAAGADSSDAHDDKTSESTTLDIVRDVVNAENKDGTASSAEGNEDDPDSEGKETAEEDNEDYSDVPFNKHPRFRQLLRAKKAADSARKVAESDAGMYRNIQKFMDENGIEAKEAADLFCFSALLRNNPQEAWKMAKPVIQQLLVACGEVLPDDLKAQVEAGQMTPEAASEVARSRAQVKTVEDSRSFEQKQRERREREDLNKSLYDTAMTWADTRRKRDPNFAAKEPLLKKEIAWLQSQEGVPNTPDKVKDQLERAYKAVVVPAARKASSAPTVGQGAPRRPSAAGGASGTAQPKPLTTLDIIRQATASRR